MLFGTNQSLFLNKFVIKMKKLLVFFLLFSFSLFAENLRTISFAEFDSLVKKFKFENFTFLESEESESYYHAAFVDMKTKNSLFINVYNFSDFTDPLSPNGKVDNLKEFEYKSNKAKYFTFNNSSLMRILAMNINSSIEIVMTPIAPKESFEKILDLTNLLNFNQQANAYPAEIPAEVQIDGQIKSIEKLEASTEGYKYEYHISIVKSERMVKSLKKILKQTSSSIDMIDYKNVTVLCGITDSMAELEKMRDGDIINFVYYIK